MTTERDILNKVHALAKAYYNIYGHYPPYIGIDWNQLCSMKIRSMEFPVLNGSIPEMMIAENTNPIDLIMPTFSIHRMEFVPFTGGVFNEVYVPRPHEKTRAFRDRRGVRGSAIFRLASMITRRKYRQRLKEIAGRHSIN